MAEKSKVGGKAGRALRELRLRVKKYPGEPDLTFEQMALECGFVDEHGKGIGTTYQYKETQFRGNVFNKDQVDMLKIPLVKRGIPEAEIYRVLAGVTVATDASSLLGKDVGFSPGAARHVPYLSSDGALRISRGEVILGSIAKLEPAAIHQLEAAGIIMGWRDWQGVSDQTVQMEVHDGLGTEILVDRADTALVEGKQYVVRYRDKAGNESMRCVTIDDGKMIAEDGLEANKALDLGDRVPPVFGRAIRLIQKL